MLEMGHKWEHIFMFYKSFFHVYQFSLPRPRTYLSLLIWDLGFAVFRATTSSSRNWLLCLLKRNRLVFARLQVGRILKRLRSKPNTIALSHAAHIF